MLASRSPRRRMLLNERGLVHDASHPGFEDSVLEPGQVTPEQWISSLAYLKAWAKASEVGLGHVILGADTACLMDGRLIGTPHSAAEAEAMIRGFVNREHEVLTGVAIIDLRGSGSPVRHIFIDRAVVRLGQLSESQISEYIAGGSWAGKAGGYNYREAAESGWPLSHTGDATTVMGLPMAKLTRRLADLGVVGCRPIVNGPADGRVARGAVA
jgi:septum formation protein